MNISAAVSPTSGVIRPDKYVCAITIRIYNDLRLQHNTHIHHITEATATPTPRHKISP